MNIQTQWLSLQNNFWQFRHFKFKHQTFEVRSFEYANPWTQHANFSNCGIKANANFVIYIGVNETQRHVQSLYCAANKLRSTFVHCSTSVKITLSRAYFVPMHAYQLWCKYTQSDYKRLRVGYSLAATPIDFWVTSQGMLLYARINISGHLTPWLETICILFLQRYASSSNCFICLFKCPMFFTNLHSPPTM